MYLSIDMGGTNTRVGFCFDLKQNYTIDDFVKFKTKKSLNKQNDYILKIVSKYKSSKIKGICFSAPGTIDYENNKFVKVPNYKILQNTNTDYFFKDKIYIDSKFFAVNDANSAGYAEAIKGVAKDYKKVLYLTIGTGIGGVIINNKSIDDVFNNFEPGHEFIFNDGLDFEDHCSGSAFNRIYKNEHNINNWIQYSKDLNKGLLFLSKKYKPDIIVLGGGFAINNFSTIKKLLIPDLNVKLCQFKDGSGIIGGFEILKSKLNIK